MFDWNYFRVPEGLARKISRLRVREEAVKVCAQNLLLGHDPSIGLGIITGKEKDLGLSLANFWKTKYEKIIKKRLKILGLKPSELPSPPSSNPGDTVYLDSDGGLTLYPNSKAQAIGVVTGDKTIKFGSLNLTSITNRAPVCKICKDHKILTNGDLQYPCPACSSKNVAKRKIIGLGERKLKIDS